MMTAPVPSGEAPDEPDRASATPAATAIAATSARTSATMRMRARVPPAGPIGCPIACSIPGCIASSVADLTKNALNDRLDFPVRGLLWEELRLRQTGAARAIMV